MNNWKKTFAIIWSGQFASILTSAIVGYAIILWLSIKTGSAEVLAFAAIAAFLPQALLGPFAGVYIDRWNRKKTMILADSFIALCTLILAVFFFWGKVDTWHIYLLLALRSVGSAFHSPAMQASVPLLAPESQLGRIAGINQMIESIGVIAGPAIAAMLISFIDIAYILLLDVIGAAFACIALLFVIIPNPEKNARDEKHVFKEMKEGLLTIISHKGMTYLFLFSILSMVCIMPISAMFPLITLKQFNGTPLQVGLVETAWGIGMLIGGLLMGMYKKPFNKVLVINIMYIFSGITIVISGFLNNNGYNTFIVLTGLDGLSSSIFYACFTALIQERIGSEKLGRVFSLYGSIAILPSIIGLSGTGFIAENIGISTSFVILGAVISCLGLISFCIPSLMNLQSKRVKNNIT